VRSHGVLSRNPLLNKIAPHRQLRGTPKNEPQEVQRIAQGMGKNGANRAAKKAAKSRNALQNKELAQWSGSEL